MILATILLYMLVLLIKIALIIALCAIPGAILFFLIKWTVEGGFWVYDRSRRAQNEKAAGEKISAGEDND